MLRVITDSTSDAKSLMARRAAAGQLSSRVQPISAPSCDGIDTRNFVLRRRRFSGIERASVQTRSSVVCRDRQAVIQEPDWRVDGNQASGAQLFDDRIEGDACGFHFTMVLCTRGGQLTTAHVPQPMSMPTAVSSFMDRSTSRLCGSPSGFTTADTTKLPGALPR
jgi:hypothetical protein